MRNLTNDLKAHRPVLILPAIAKAFLERCASVEIPLGAKASDLDDMLSAMFGARPKMEVFPPYAIVPIKGVIGRGLSEVEKACGSCDIEDVEEMLEAAERNESVKTIILDVDSPGGTSIGVPELAKRIRECKKQTISFTSGDCCSAAYWLASQAGEFYATPSSSVGSIGCYIAFHDYKAAFQSEGVVVDVIKAGALKGTGIPGTSLTDEQRAMLQEEVDEIHADFKADVLMVREFASESDMDGRQFSGKKAAEIGLVTSLVNGFDELMETLDAAVAAQMEADEANDEAAGIPSDVSPESEDEDEEDEGLSRMAHGRALAGLKGVTALKDGLVVKSEKSPEEEEDEGTEPNPKKSKKAKKSEDQPGEEGEDEEKDMKAEDGEEDKKPESEDEEKDKPESEDEEKEKPESDEDEGEEDDGDDEEDTEPVAEGEEGEEDKDEEKSEPESNEKAEEEADAGEKAVDTDSEEDKKAKKNRNRSRGVA